jgi:hypothetical protein
MSRAKEMSMGARRVMFEKSDIVIVTLFAIYFPVYMMDR